MYATDDAKMPAAAAAATNSAHWQYARVSGRSNDDQEFIRDRRSQPPRASCSDIQHGN